MAAARDFINCNVKNILCKICTCDKIYIGGICRSLKAPIIPMMYNNTDEPTHN